MSYLSDADPTYHDSLNLQKSGSGYRVSLNYSFRPDMIEFEIRLFEIFWDIAQSEPADLTKNGVNIGYVYEPKNISTEIGLSLCMKY